MPNLSLTTGDGGSTSVADSAVERLRAHLAGTLCLPGEPGYDEARTLWNAMIDRRPGLVVRAGRPEDVQAAVRFAREHGLLLAVRGGGHNIAGNACCDGGLMIDLSLLTGVKVDPAAKTATVEPGARLSHVDRATQEHGLAVPLGINSTTGVAGLTLGGGFGWLSRKYGLTIDNLLEVEIVTPDGEIRRANENENPDLFWAVRGGGGNFGVVTSFKYRLHKVGPQVIAGLVVYPLDQAKAVLQGYRRFLGSAPDEACVWVVMRKAPPLPFLPESIHGKDIVALAQCFIGDPAKADEVLGPLKTFGTPAGTHVGPVSYADWQAAFDGLLGPGARNYWKSQDFREIPDGLIEVLIQAASTLPDPETDVFIAHLGAAVNRVPKDATAYPHRDVEFVMNAHGRWMDPTKDKSSIAWARALTEATAPFATGGVYINFLTEDEAARTATGGFASNYERLARLKARYDPTNLLRVNPNVRPAEHAKTPGT